MALRQHHNHHCVDLACPELGQPAAVNCAARRVNENWRNARRLVPRKTNGDTPAAGGAHRLYADYCFSEWEQAMDASGYRTFNPDSPAPVILDRHALVELTDTIPVASARFPMLSSHFTVSSWILPAYLQSLSSPTSANNRRPECHSVVQPRKMKSSSSKTTDDDNHRAALKKTNAG